MKGISNIILVSLVLLCLASCDDFSSQKASSKIVENVFALPKDSLQTQHSSIPACCVQMPARGSRKVVK